MTLLTTTLFICSIAFTLTISNSPIILGLWILLLALTGSVFLSISITSWLRIFIFLIYVGGLLIIFSYFVALSPNQYVSLKYPITLFTATVFIIAPIFLLPISLNTEISKPLFGSMSYLLHLNNIPIFCVIGLTLFLALVAVVKIRGGSSAPLRPYS